MLPIEETRRTNLLLLIRRHGGQRELADAAGIKSTAQISQLVTRAKHTQTGRSRVMGSRFARSLEGGIGLPSGWMDTLHADDEQIHPVILSKDEDNFTSDEAEMLELYRLVSPKMRDALIGSARASLDTPPEISKADLIRKLRPHPDHLAQLEAMGVIPRSKVSTSESEADQHRTKIQRKGSS